MADVISMYRLHMKMCKFQGIKKCIMLKTPKVSQVSLIFFFMVYHVNDSGLKKGIARLQ